jgi:transcriptional regulator with XRE-family HTH domain
MPGHPQSSEHAIARVGADVARFRLSRNMTQATLAAEAGISQSTLKRLEKGENPTLDSLVRVLGVLGLSQNLALLAPNAGVSPLQLASNKGHVRQRARHSAVDANKESKPWMWDKP